MKELSVAPVAVVGDETTLTDPVWQNATAAPDAVQFLRRVGGGEWQEVTCAQFRDSVTALARGLIAAGIQPGDRVGLMSGTRYEWTLIDYAIWAAGAVTVPIYETSSPEQVAWILSDSGAVACFVETDVHRAALAKSRHPLPGGIGPWQIEGRHSVIDDLVAEGATVAVEDVERRRHDIDADDTATIVYTSGTTGRPKGCVLTHRNLSSGIRNMLPGLRSLFGQDASTLLFLPLAHAFARIVQIGCVQARVRMGYSPGGANLAADLKAFRPTFVLSVPRMYEKIYATAQQRARGGIFRRAERVAVAYSRSVDREGPGLLLRLQHALFGTLVYRRIRAALGGRCRHAICGGAPLGERLAHFYRGAGIDVREGYGLTETSPVVTFNLDDGVRIGTTGRPVPGTTVRIADDGEILVNGPQVFAGYWNDEPATAQCLDQDGWFRTGDLGDLDDDGFLRITGRRKDLIVTAGGKNVAPDGLEDRLRAHPLVSQCVVVGDRRPFISALVTIDEHAFATWKARNGEPAGASVADLRADTRLCSAVQQAVDDANETVSKAESIRAFRILPRDFSESTGELTATQKVRRQVVTEEHAEEIAAMYA
ncbi:long-chain fatty acid--CoA ligase [Dactylosporangium sp. NPDC051485]|uniref:AMP-dependent synthetase/ligase n=1 Tax=Dactylosporangium sp. NPDC051485 TaxID=3154846 RepID=UPI003414A6BC